MFVFIVRRLFMLPVVLFVVSLIIFALVQTIPPVKRASFFVQSEQQAQRIDEIVRQYGLDKPFYVQYYIWVKEALQGNLGYSRTSNEPVAKTIRRRLPASAELALFAVLPVIGFAIWLGTLAALNRDKLIDQFSRILAVVGWSFPDFVLGIWLLTFFYGGLGLFGIGRISTEFVTEIASGNITTPTGFMTIDAIINGRLDLFVDAIMHLILPALTLGILINARIMRVMRTSLLDALSQDYVRTARAKGLPDKVVNLKHARRNALIPVITLSGLTIVGLLNGSLIVETIFNYRGLGQWFAESAVQFDIPSVTGFALLTGVLIVLANLAVDVLYALVDPRIRYS